MSLVLSCSVVSVWGVQISFMDKMCDSSYRCWELVSDVQPSYNFECGILCVFAVSVDHM